MAYDPNNVFARILRGEIPCKKVYEDQHVLAFDLVNRQIVLHGGYAGGADVLSDTWVLSCEPECYPDCDTSTGVGVLDVFDFL